MILKIVTYFLLFDSLYHLLRYFLFIENFDTNSLLMKGFSSLLGTFYGFLKLLKYILTDHVKVYRTER